MQVDDSLRHAISSPTPAQVDVMWHQVKHVLHDNVSTADSSTSRARHKKKVESQSVYTAYEYAFKKRKHGGESGGAPPGNHLIRRRKRNKVGETGIPHNDISVSAGPHLTQGIAGMPSALHIHPGAIHNLQSAMPGMPPPGIPGMSSGMVPPGMPMPGMIPHHVLHHHPMTTIGDAAALAAAEAAALEAAAAAAVVIPHPGYHHGHQMQHPTVTMSMSMAAPAALQNSLNHGAINHQ